jgi:transcriptional regulator with XRE-family HTH domain
MADKPALRLTPSVRPSLKAKALLLARLHTAQLLTMKEPEVAEVIRSIEADPLFQKMVFPPEPAWKVVRFRPHPRTRLSGSFYELNENAVPADAPADVAGLLEERQDMLSLIRRVGRENFEKFFLRAEENASPREVTEACGVTPAEMERLRDFLLAFSVRAEFFDPSSVQIESRSGGPTVRAVRLAWLTVGPDGELSFDLLSPHLARGRYDINYDQFHGLIQRPDLSPEQKRHLKALVRRLELVNWRQSALFRILDFLCHTQRDYLASRDPLKKKPITQRQMARRLSVAPSTVNRAIQGRSLLLPWEEETLLEGLFSSRKDLCLDALNAWEAEDGEFSRRTDAELRDRLKQELGVSVPRRTVNTYRRYLEKKADG